MKKKKKMTKMEMEIKDMKWKMRKTEGDVRWLKAKINDIKKKQDEMSRLLEIGNGNKEIRISTFS